LTALARATASSPIALRVLASRKGSALPRSPSDAALDRALAFPQVEAVALAVGDELDLDVARSSMYSR